MEWAMLTNTQKERLALLCYGRAMIPNNKGAYALGGNGHDGDRELAALGLIEDSCPWEAFKFVRITAAGLKAIENYESLKC